MGYRNRYTVSNRYELVFMEGMEKVKPKRMRLRDTIKRIKKSWDKVNGSRSELLITILTIIILWILLTHNV
jgi:hypothetical protein